MKWGPWWRVDGGPVDEGNKDLRDARMKHQMIRIHVNFPLRAEVMGSDNQLRLKNTFFDNHFDDIKRVPGLEGMEMLTTHSMVLVFGFMFDRQEFIRDMLKILDRYRADEPITIRSI